MDMNEISAIRNILGKNCLKNGDCIEWTGKLNKGYGIFYFKGKIWSAHRASFYVQNSCIPKDLYVCHKCNNKKCINPDHLYSGTPKQNYDDFKNSSYFKEILNKTLNIRKNNVVFKQKKYEEFILSFLSVKEFSEILNVHENTVRRAISSGHINAIRTGCGSRSSFRIPASEINRMALFDLQKVVKDLTMQKLKELNEK